MMSLRKRLGRGVISLLCLIFVIHWVAADWVIRSAAKKQMANRLADDGYSLLETLAYSDDDQVTFNNFHISSVYKRRLSGHYYVVKVNAQAYPSPSLLDYPLAVEPIGPEQSRLYHLTGPNSTPLLVLTLGAVRFGHRINISVAEDLSAIDHDITAIRAAYFGLTLLILLSAIALLRWDVGRALQPLDSVAGELEQVADGSRQKIEAEVPAEIKPLVMEINHLLELVARRLQQSRTAMGNLAHALKSPMTLLLRAGEDPLLNARPDLRTLLTAQTDNIQHLIERELKRARIAGDPQTASSFNPRREIIALKKTMRSIYAEKTLDIQITAPDQTLHFDREDLMEILGNLLDNACKWANGRIDVELTIAKDRLVISVADDGPGCEETQLLYLTQRGQRLDESVHGHGLGLGIVLDIVNSYQGQIRFARSKTLDGFLATVNLTLHRQPPSPKHFSVSIQPASLN